jgi:hypothetical protein
MSRKGPDYQRIARWWRCPGISKWMINSRQAVNSDVRAHEGVSFVLGSALKPARIPMLDVAMIQLYPLQ